MEPAPVKEQISDKAGFASRLWIRWFQLVQRALGTCVIETVRITFSDSPYTIPDPGVNMVCDTDAGAIVVNYPVGVQGAPIRVVNVGRSAHNVTLNGNGTELIDKAASKVLADAAVYDSRFDAIEGWN